MRDQKNRSNKSGVVLLTAVAVLAMLSILLTAALSFVATNQRQTMTNYKREQAYQTASSTLESFIAKIQRDTAPTTVEADKAAQKKAIEDLKTLAKADGGKGTVTNVKINGNTNNTDNMGTCKIRVQQEDANATNIVITCEATYLGETQTVAAHISTDSKNKKADFTNTIELTGSAGVTYDNLNVVGDMGGINETTGKTYTFTNDSTVYGNYFMYGSLVNTTNLSLYLMPSLIDESQGTSITVSENLVNNSNNFKIVSTMPFAEGYNYVNIGGKFENKLKAYVGTSGFDVDVYCGEFENKSDTYVQYGNMYVYKNGLGNGNVTFGSNSKVTINGDLYVEGNIVVDADASTDVTVNGDIYVTGTVTNESKIKLGAGKSIHKGTVMTKSGRSKAPEIPIKANEYVYFPEDFLKSSDPSITTISTDYDKLSKNTNKKTFNDFVNKGYSVTSTVDGSNVTSKYNFHVTESCTWDSVNFNDYGNGKMKVLVDVTDTSGDIVIMIKNNMKLDSGWRPTIIVRNTSSVVDAATNAHKYNCYFVSDAGTSIKLNGMVDGVSTHSGAVSCSYSFENLLILDYETYVRMYTGVDNPDARGTQNTSFVLNPTSVDVAGTYRPNSGGIIFLFTEGTLFKTTNNSFVQGAFYCPQATIDIATSGVGVRTTDSRGNISTYQTCNVGIIVADKFGSANKAFYTFQQPSSSSILANAKGGKDDTAFGYNLQRYDHY